MLNFLLRLVTLFCFVPGHPQLYDGLYAALPPTAEPVDPPHLSAGEKQRLPDNPINKRREYLHKCSRLSQEPEATVFNTWDEDSKINGMYSLPDFYRYTCDRKTISFSHQALILSGRYPGYLKYSGLAGNSLAETYLKKKRYDSAILYCYKEIAYCRQTHDSSQTGFYHVYRLFSNIYFQSGMYEKTALYNNFTTNIAAQKKWTNQYLQRCLTKISVYTGLYRTTRQKPYADTALYVATQILDKPAYSDFFSSACCLPAKLSYEIRGYRRARCYCNSFLAKNNFKTRNDIMIAQKAHEQKMRCLVHPGNTTPGLRFLKNTPGISSETKEKIYEVLYQHAASVKDWHNVFILYQEYVSSKDSSKTGDIQNQHPEIEQKYTLREQQAQITALKNKSLLDEKGKTKLFYTSISTSFTLLVVIAFFSIMYRHSQIKRNAEQQLLTSELYRLESTIQDERQLQLEQMAEQRRKIAADLHDEVSSGLAAFRFYIVDLRAKAGSEDVANVLTELEAEAHVLYQQARMFMKNLNASRPPGHYNAYMLAEQLASRFNNEKILCIKNNMDAEGINRFFTPSMHYEMYLIIKEAVANCIKHAGATRINISVCFKSHTCFFSIEDNGRGFDRTGESDGLGLRSMSNRIANIGGRLQIYSTRRGTILNGSFPI